MQPQEIVLAGLLFVLAAAAVVGLYFAARYMRTVLGDAKFKELTETIRTYIQAAEQMAKSGQLAKDERFDWVVTQIAAKFPQLSKATIAAYVESAVYALNLGAQILGPLTAFPPAQEGEIRLAEPGGLTYTIRGDAAVGATYTIRGDAAAGTFNPDVD